MQGLDLVCPHLDLALLSCSHLDEQATCSLLADVVARGAGLALATRGLDGAIAHDGRVTVRAAARPAATDAVVDTMGCGDAFLTAFAVALLRSGWAKRSAPSADRIRQALTDGAAAARDQCLTEAAFGHGRAFGSVLPPKPEPPTRRE